MSSEPQMSEVGFPILLGKPQSQQLGLTSRTKKSLNTVHTTPSSASIQKLVNLSDIFYTVNTGRS